MGRGPPSCKNQHGCFWICNCKEFVDLSTDSENFKQSLHARGNAGDLRFLRQRIILHGLGKLWKTISSQHSSSLQLQIQVRTKQSTSHIINTQKFCWLLWARSHPRWTKWKSVFWWRVHISLWFWKSRTLSPSGWGKSYHPDCYQGSKFKIQHLWGYGGVPAPMAWVRCTSVEALLMLKGIWIYIHFGTTCYHPDDIFFSRTMPWYTIYTLQHCGSAVLDFWTSISV